MTMIRESPGALGPPLVSAWACGFPVADAASSLVKSSRVQHSAVVAAVLATALLLPALPRTATAQFSCCAEGPLGPQSQNCNVIAIADDQITACPGGDSVNVFAPGHPKWLRIRIHYEDNDCNF